MRLSKGLITIFLLAAALFSSTAETRIQNLQAGVPVGAYTNFEGAQTSPIRLSQDGRRLFALNTADNRLSVFDLFDAANPLLSREIPVGYEPVSVNPRTEDEVWVVNQVSDSISIVSISRGAVIDTIQVGDEPADVAFAGSNLAFVTVSRKNEVRVFNVNTRQQVATIPLQGENPRALAVSPDRRKVYAAFALSGNRTTIIPQQKAPSPPAPTNRNLPPAPRQGLIVDAKDPAWNPSFIKYNMPDNDVAQIDATNLSVTRYFPRVGAVNLGLAVRPTTGDLYVANTEARNLVRFEPNLRGHVVDNRLTRIVVSTAKVTAFDLNPGINYALLPNPQARAQAIAQPTAVVFEPGGNFMYVASFGTDRIARVDSKGVVQAVIEVGAGSDPNLIAPRNKRGPRGLALNSVAPFLYALNRISNTISVIDVQRAMAVNEFPVGSYDPTPTVIRQGRGFLYDARLSGNGTASCASCHIDADMDLLAWDLGDPGGQMQTVVDFGNSFQMHPMKGPMTTQTLRGLSALEPLHWRGDRASFLAFNPAFDKLLGGSQLSSADMAAYRDFVNTLQFQPNPNQKLDRTLPSSFAGGDPVAGRNTFMNEQFTNGVTCNTCHTANPGTGTNKRIIPANLLQEPQHFKVPHLRNIYQKLGFNNASGATSIAGFGITHDGADPNLIAFLSRPVFQRFANDTIRKRNLSAFVQCFDTGTAPAVGYTRTVTSANVNNSAIISDWALLENQAAVGNIELIIKGVIDGQQRGLLYRPSSNDYMTDRAGDSPMTKAQLRAKVVAGSTLSVMGVPPGSGGRMGVDRNLDGVLDGD